MNCFISTNTDIYYNLALEEFLLKNRSEDFFFLWQSKPVVVVGKHQNPYKEIDINFAIDNQIQVARRLSGGGTVYQDLGGINFTFIKNTEEGKQINLKQHSKPIFDALNILGLNVNYSDRNDLLLNDKKISGNAEHVYKNRVLHHGTLLFNSNLDRLEQVLKNNYEQYTDKTIVSVKSKVANIQPYLQQKISVIDFQKNILNLVIEQSSVNFQIEEPQCPQIEKLKVQKYKTEDWIFAYTSKYELRNYLNIDGVEYSYSLKVQKGIITEFEVDNLNQEIFQEIKKKLIKQRHLYKTLQEILLSFPKEYRCLYRNMF